jgi:hypothetical protein
MSPRVLKTSSNLVALQSGKFTSYTWKQSLKVSSNLVGSPEPVRLSFQSLISSQPTVFFSHNKSANNIFSRLFSANLKN